jgi:hypothetical protein
LIVRRRQHAHYGATQGLIVVDDDDERIIARHSSSHGARDQLRCYWVFTMATVCVAGDPQHWL